MCGGVGLPLVVAGAVVRGTDTQGAVDLKVEPVQDPNLNIDGFRD